jgi:cell division protein FtsZ
MLTEHVDTLITIPNEKLMSLGDDELTFVEAFRKADEVLYQAVRGISDLITLDGIVNVDFADVRTVMSSMGRALMGTGMAKGDGRARLAAEQAIASPLLDDISVDGATGVLINVVGGPDMKMREIQEAASLIQEQAHDDANIIFGASIDENMGEAIKVTVIATGFGQAEAEMQPELVQAARRAGSRGSVVQESFVAPPRSSVPSRPEPAPAYAGARKQLHSSAVSHASSGPAIRDRITFPAGEVDLDWDTPAYQRRQGG